MSTTRVIGLGNTLLTDDGVGVYAVRAVRRRLAGRALDVDVVESEVAGFALLELMAGFERVILVDAITFDAVTPGTVVQIDPRDLRTSLRLRAVHEIDLPTAFELAAQLGMPVPRELVVFGVQVEDCLTLGEGLTERVRAGCAEAVSLVLAELGAHEPQQSSAMPAAG
jgi:hydrogenase maturation protease